jgi:hypothetical protein
MCRTVARVTPAFAQSVLQARQKGSTRSMTVRLAAIASSVIGTFAGLGIWPRTRRRAPASFYAGSPWSSRQSSQEF